MKPYILSAFLLLCVCTVIAQNKKKVVEGSDDGNAGLPDSIKYKYPSFTSGLVTFKDGKQGGSLLNYNLITGEVQFINLNGDTLSLANENTIKSITINQDTFYFDKLYLQLVEGNTNAKLAKSEKMNLADEKKMGAFGLYSSSGGIESYSSINTGSRTMHLEQNKQLTFRMHTTYYISDRYYHFLPVTKKNVVKIFNKQGIEDYLNTSKVDLHNEQDLEKMLVFINDKGQ